MDKKFKWSESNKDYHFFNGETDALFDDSWSGYIYETWMNYNDTLEIAGSDYDCKADFVWKLGNLYGAYDVNEMGRIKLFGIEYCRNQDDLYGGPMQEMVLIWHDDQMKYCTVVNVTGDSLEAMQRDIMRAVMR